MIHRGRDWFMGRSRREQLLLAAAGIISLILIIVFLITIPLINGIEDARDRYAEAVTRHGRIAAKVDMLSSARASDGRPPSGPLLDFIRQSAGSAGFTLDSAEASGDGKVTLQIESATPQALFGWLGGLEGRGISVENLTVDPAPNNSGAVRVGATLDRLS